jgi:hypothetical protein
MMMMMILHTQQKRLNVTPFSVSYNTTNEIGNIIMFCAGFVEDSFYYFSLVNVGGVGHRWMTDCKPCPMQNDNKYNRTTNRKVCLQQRQRGHIN